MPFPPLLSPATQISDPQAATAHRDGQQHAQDGPVVPAIRIRAQRGHGTRCASICTLGLGHGHRRGCGRGRCHGRWVGRRLGLGGVRLREGARRTDLPDLASRPVPASPPGRLPQPRPRVLRLRRLDLDVPPLRALPPLGLPPRRAHPRPGRIVVPEPVRAHSSVFLPSVRSRPAVNLRRAITHRSDRASRNARCARVPPIERSTPCGFLFADLDSLCRAATGNGRS